MRRRLSTLLALPLTAATLFAEPQPTTTSIAAPSDEAVTYRAAPAASEIRIDGVLDEPAWSKATPISLDYEWFPGDNIAPPVKTLAWITYDDEHLYVAFRALDPEPGQIRAHFMDRDQIGTFVQDDFVLILLDTFNDQRRAFQFRINPLGVQADAILSEVAGVEDFSWDMLWESAAAIHARGYDVEVALPLDQLRFPNVRGEQTWGIELERSWPRSSRHRISAAPHDRNVACLLCEIHKLTGLQGIQPGRNLELDPTLTGLRTEELDRFPDGSLEAADEEVEGGLTVRWGITPNVTLTGALNPDFSQVEADAAQLGVNERFALFFEEKRPFFLEAVDTFATPFDAVFTRTVVDPDWGAKLTGKSGAHAFGIFAAEDAVNALVFPSNQGSVSTLLNDPITSGVLRYRRDVGEASTLGLLYSGREGGSYHNHVAGVDGFLRLSDKDFLSFQYLTSDTRYPDEVSLEFDQPRGSFADDALLIEYGREAELWSWSLELQDRGPDFRLDSGFMPRVDIRQIEGRLMRKFWGREGDWYDRWRVGAVVERVEDHDGQLTDEELELFIDLSGPLQSFVELEVERNRQFVRGVLYEDLDVVGLYAEMQPAGALRLELSAALGETVDFTNNRRADGVRLNPSVEAKLGRHVNLELDHLLERLDVDGGRLFEANLSQLRLVYNFSTRMFVRGILQWLDLQRDPRLYLEPVDPDTETLFSQLLFSYKLNARTVLFLGYSDNQLGLNDIDLTRTFFAKLGYAWTL